MDKSIKQLWEERAAAQGRVPDYVSANVGRFPPDYKFTLNWSVSSLAPLVSDPLQDGRANEVAYYNEATKLFIKDAKATLERIKRVDRANAARIERLIDRMQKEEPSSDLLSQYAIFRPIVSNAMEATAAAQTTANLITDDAEGALTVIGQHFYKVMHSGKAVLYDVRHDEWTTYKDCADHYAHRKVQWLNPDTGKFSSKNAFMAFKEWDKAPRYDAVVFNPRRDGHYADKFNLWQGFTVEAEEGDEDLMVWDLLNRICDGNEDYFEYVQKWLAHMVQKPWELPGTALGVSGTQGLGKNAFIETIGLLMSSKQMIDMMQDKERQYEVLGKVLSTGAYGYFTSYDEVFGNFNALAGNKILLFLDEATWGGGHTQKARLKTAITGQSVTINDKNMKHLVVSNFRRFIFASNEEFYYGADPSDRRLLPLEFKTENRPTDAWFKEFYETRSKGKMLNHLLHRLKNVDLAGWEPMKALRSLSIVTGGAIQSESAADFQQWMDDIADTGTLLLPGDSEVPELRIQATGCFLSEDRLRTSFQHWTNRRDMKGWTRAEFVAARDKIFGNRVQKRVNGEKPYGREMPLQADMRQRLDSQYSWKRDRWGELQDEGKPVNAYTQAMRNVTLMP